MNVHFSKIYYLYENNKTGNKTVFWYVMRYEKKKKTEYRGRTLNNWPFSRLLFYSLLYIIRAVVIIDKCTETSSLSTICFMLQ